MKKKQDVEWPCGLPLFLFFIRVFFPVLVFFPVFLFFPFFFVAHGIALLWGLTEGSCDSLKTSVFDDTGLF